MSKNIEKFVFYCIRYWHFEGDDIKFNITFPNVINNCNNSSNWDKIYVHHVDTDQHYSLVLTSTQINDTVQVGLI